MSAIEASDISDKENGEDTLREASALAPAVLNMPSTQFYSQWAIQLSTCLRKWNAAIIEDKLLSIVNKLRDKYSIISFRSIKCLTYRPK